MIRAETQTDLIRVNDGAQGPQGIQGPQGEKGETGATGESIASITNYYLATSASSGVTRSTSGWTTTIQTIDSTNQYLWNYEVVTGSAGSTLSTTNPVIIGRYGLNGGTGKGISGITEYYLATSASSGVTTSTSGWTTSVQSTDATNKYLWNYEVISYTSGNPYTSSPRIIGTYGDKGEKGDTGSQGPQGVQGVQGPKGDTPTITATKSNGATVVYVDGSSVATINDGAKGDKGDKGDTPSITASKSGTVTTIKVDGTTVATVNDGTNGTTPTITASKSGDTTTIYANGAAIGTVVDGDDGNTPAITASKSGTTTTIKVDGVTIATVEDGSQGPQGIQGIQGPKGDTGDTGESISSITNYYLATSASSGVTTSTSGWTTSIQTMTSTNQYLWNYEVVTGSKGSTLNTTTPVIIGRYGQNGGTGKGISGITEYYLATSASSGVTTSTSGWTTAVQTTDATNKYLWNYEVISYTSGNPYTSSPRIIGTYGDKGDQGIQGPQGNDGNDASISVSKSGSTATITAVSGDGTTTTTTVTDGTNGTNGTNGKSAYQSAVDGGYSGTEANFNSDLADVSNKAPLTIIREYNNGVLVGKTGQTVGALVNANGTFDVVDVTWSSNTPTAGDPVATFGTTTTIGVPHNNRLQLNSHSMKLLDNSDNEYFVIDDVRDQYGETTVVETHTVFQLHRGSQGDCHWAQTGIAKFGTELPISSVTGIKINGVELNDFTKITVDKNDTYVYSGTCPCLYDAPIIIDPDDPLGGDDPILLDPTPSSSGNSWDNWNLTTLPNGKTIIDNDEESEFMGVSMGLVARRPYKIQGMSKVTINDLTLLDIPTGYQQIALSEIEITYTTNSSYSLQYLTFGSRKAPVTIRTGSISLGYDNDVTGFYSYGEGYQVTSSGLASHAEGYRTKATRQYAHAEGISTTADGISSHAEGNQTYAMDLGAHAEGINTQALGDASHAQNRSTIAQRYDETVIGSYNTVDGYDVWKINTAYAVGDIAIYDSDMYSCHTAHTSTNSFRTDEGSYWTKLRKAGRALIVGNGTSGKRSNAAIIDWDGNYMGQGMAGMVQMYAGATIPNGWLLCDGSEYDIADYPELNDALGGDSSAGTAATLWGTASVNTKFKVPDLRGRAPIGAGTGSGLTARTLGAMNIGSETHALTAAQTGIRNHTHTYSDYNTTYTLGTTKRKPGTSTAVAYGTSLTAGGGATTRTSNNPASEQSGAAHPNMQPSAVVNFIIATGNTHA